MKLINTILEDDETLSDEERNKIINLGNTIYKVYKRGTYKLDENSRFFKEKTFKFRLSDKYFSDVTYEFESEDSDKLIPSCLLCVEKVYIFTPQHFSSGVLNDNVVRGSLKIYEIFKKHGVNLYVGEFGKCKLITSEAERWSRHSNIVIIDDIEEWEEMFKSS